jgi:hypothetical protein
MRYAHRSPGFCPEPPHEAVEFEDVAELNTFLGKWAVRVVGIAWRGERLVAIIEEDSTTS